MSIKVLHHCSSVISVTPRSERLVDSNSVQVSRIVQVGCQDGSLQKKELH